MSDTEFATASPRRSILFVALSPDDADTVGEGLKAKSRRWRLEFARTSGQALQLLREYPFDAVLINLQAAGIEPHRFLKETMETSPEALRIGLTSLDQRQGMNQASAPVHQFLSRPLDPMILTAVLARAFAAQDFLIQDHFRRLVDNITTLPALPDAYARIMEQLDQDDPSPERIGELITMDMGLSVRVLQLANSAFFGLSRVLVHPSEAVMFLGVATVKALVLGVSVFSQFNRVRLKAFSPEALWQHSWDTAMLARRLCEFEKTDRVVADEAFLSGLLHDLGKLVFAANYPTMLEENLAEADRKKIQLWEQEFTTHGASHAELGGYLLRRWGLPAGVVDAVTFHHRPLLARIRTFAAVTAVHVANALPRRVGLPPLRSADDDANPGGTLDLSYLRSLGMENRIDDWARVIVAETDRREAAVA